MVVLKLFVFPSFVPLCLLPLYVGDLTSKSIFLGLLTLIFIIGGDDHMLWGSVLYDAHQVARVML